MPVPNSNIQIPSDRSLVKWLNKCLYETYKNKNCTSKYIGIHEILLTKKNNEGLNTIRNTKRSIPILILLGIQETKNAAIKVTINIIVVLKWCPKP